MDAMVAARHSLTRGRTIHGRADLVAHVRQELALGGTRCLCRLLGRPQRLLLPLHRREVPPGGEVEATATDAEELGGQRDRGEGGRKWGGTGGGEEGGVTGCGMRERQQQLMF